MEKSHTVLILYCLVCLSFILLFALFSQHPASMNETDHWDAQHARETATGLCCAIIVPKLSKCQWRLQGMPGAGVYLFSECLCGFVPPHVCRVSLLARGWIHAVILPHFLNEMLLIVVVDKKHSIYVCVLYIREWLLFGLCSAAYV